MLASPMIGGVKSVARNRRTERAWYVDAKKTAQTLQRKDFSQIIGGEGPEGGTHVHIAALSTKMAKTCCEVIHETMKDELRWEAHHH